MIYFIVFLLLTGGFLLVIMLQQAFANNVREQELCYTDFPKSFNNIKIFFISDIHRRVISEKVINRVKGKADLVIIGGDLVEKGVSFERVKTNLRKLNQLCPVFFVWGNNDYEVDNAEFLEVLLKAGIKVLNNTAATFESDQGEKISILGIDTMNLKRDRLDQALAITPEKSFKILASHYPDIVQTIHPEQNIRLILSGHTHGGQIHILGYSPYRRGGIKRFGNTIQIISNGYGTTAIPLRLGAPAECHLITLKRP